MRTPSVPQPLPPARVRTRVAPQVQPTISADKAAQPQTVATSALRPGEPSTAYDVGYGKPPMSTRFQPGRSGNPKGRPRAAKSLQTIVCERLDRKKKVRVGGKQVTLTSREVLVEQQLEAAHKGDRAAIKFLFANDPRTLAAAVDEAVAAEAALSAEEEALLAKLLGRLASDGEDD